MTTREHALFEVDDLCVDVGARRVVHGVSLRIAPGECVGIVGESGSGKSLTLRSVIGLLPRGVRRSSGELRFDGSAYRPEDLRGHGIAMVFQEPMTALNPTRRAADLVADGVLSGRRERLTRRRAREIAVDLMREVGIPDPATRARAFPHQLSGGLRQRVMIAMALSGNPRLLLCDEPTTALDMRVQDQILGLLDRLRQERGLGLLFVTHDLGVVARVSQRIAVMHGGRLVEQGATADVLASPQHAYTASLRAAASAIEGRRFEAEVC